MTRMLPRSVLRTVVVGAAVAVGVALVVPTPALAAPRGESTLTLISPTSGSTIGPGQQFHGGDLDVLLAEGTEVRITALLLPDADDEHPCAGTVVGSGALDPDNMFHVEMDSPLPDGTYVFGVCAGPLATTAVVTMDNPFDVVAPAPGSTLAPGEAISSGVGSPGSTVEARDASGTVLGSSTVDADGAWTMPLTGLVAGPLTVVFTQDAKVVTADFVVRAPAGGDGGEAVPEDGGESKPGPGTEAPIGTEPDIAAPDIAAPAAPVPAARAAGPHVRADALAATGSDAGTWVAAAALLLLAGLAAIVAVAVRRQPRPVVATRRAAGSGDGVS